VAAEVRSGWDPRNRDVWDRPSLSWLKATPSPDASTPAGGGRPLPEGQTPLRAARGRVQRRIVATPIKRERHAKRLVPRLSRVRGVPVTGWVEPRRLRPSGRGLLYRGPRTHQFLFLLRGLRSEGRRAACCHPQLSDKASDSPQTIVLTGLGVRPGYWLVASDGGVFTFGDAAFFGSTGGMALREPIVSIARNPAP
jgi:hypothetical protein